MPFNVNSYFTSSLEDYFSPDKISARRKKLYEGMGALPGLVEDTPESEERATSILPNPFKEGDSVMSRFLNSALSTFVDQPRQVADLAEMIPALAEDKSKPTGVGNLLLRAGAKTASYLAPGAIYGLGDEALQLPKKALNKLDEATGGLVTKGKEYYEGSREAMLGATGDPLSNVILQTAAELTPDILTAQIGAGGFLGASKKAAAGANLPPLERVLSEIGAVVEPEPKKLSPLEALNEILENNKRAAKAQLDQEQAAINEAVVDQRLQAEMQASSDPTIVAHEAETLAAEERINRALELLDNTEDAMAKNDPNQFVNLDATLPQMYGRPLINEKKLGYSGVRDVEAYEPNMFGDSPQSLGGVRQGSPKKIEDINAYEFRNDPPFTPAVQKSAKERRAEELEILFRARTEASRELDDMVSAQEFPTDTVVADKVSNLILFDEGAETITPVIEKQVGQTMSAKERLAKMKEHINEQLVKNSDGTPETAIRNAETVQQSVVENAADAAGGELVPPLPEVWRNFVLDETLSVPINKENATARFYKALEYAKLKAKLAAERKVESLAKAGLLQSEKDAAIYIGNSIAQVEDAGRLHAAKWAQSGTLEDEILAAIDGSTDEIMKQHKLDPNLPGLGRPIIDKEAKELAVASKWLSENGLDAKDIRQMTFEDIYSLNVAMAKKQAPVEVFEAVQSEVQRRLGTQKGTVASFERIVDEALCN